LAAAFDSAYREKFGRNPPAVPLEFINARVSLRVAVAGSHIADLTGAVGAAPTGAIKGRRRAWFAEAGGFVDATVYDRDRLAANSTITGPALIEDPGSTLVIGPAGTAQVMPSGSIVVELR
jgi:N-methylhydantoinase A